MNENQVTAAENMDSAAQAMLSPPPSIGKVGFVPETGIRFCPLCNSEIKLFFINLNEKIIMCENTDCEFPFGYEDLQFVKEDNGFEVNEEVDSIKCFKMESAAPTGSVLSSAAWFDIDQLNAALQSEITPSDLIESTSMRSEHIKRRESEKKMREQLEDIKTMAIELQTQVTKEKQEDKMDAQIKNQKWLRNLKSLQEMSGVQLLKPEEVGRLKKEEPVLGLGELKININPGDGYTMSSIQIEIHDNHLDEANEAESTDANDVNAT